MDKTGYYHYKLLCEKLYNIKYIKYNKKVYIPHKNVDIFYILVIHGNVIIQ